MIDQSGKDSGFKLSIAHFGPAQQFYPIPKFAGKFYVHTVQIADAANRHFRIGIVNAPGQPDEQNKLMCSIIAINIESRICFGIALFLRISQGSIERSPFACHFGKNVVPGTIQNTFKGVYLIAGETFLEGFHNGNTSCDTGFIAQGSLLFFGQPEQTGSLFGKESLVGCNDLLAIFKTAGNQLFGSFNPSHQFDDHINFRICGQLHGVIQQLNTIRQIALAGGIPYGNAFQANITTGSSPEFFLVFRKQVDKTAANSAESGKTYGQYVTGHACSFMLMKLPHDLTWYIGSIVSLCIVRLLFL